MSIYLNNYLIKIMFLEWFGKGFLKLEDFSNIRFFSMKFRFEFYYDLVEIRVDLLCVFNYG